MPADALIFTPDDVDLAHSPLRRGIDEPTYVLGAFNPGFTRLPSGNLLMMVRIAEALSEPVAGGAVRAIRWTPSGYVLDVMLWLAFRCLLLLMLPKLRILWK